MVQNLFYRFLNSAGASRSSQNRLTTEQKYSLFPLGIDLQQFIWYKYFIIHLGRDEFLSTDSTQQSFRRGVMSLVILALLKREDMYGYQLVQETANASGGRLTTQEGSLYPVLYRLLDQGMISDRKVQVSKRMSRIYYHLEPSGEARLQELIREYEDMTQGVFQIIREEGGRHGQA